MIMMEASRRTCSFQKYPSPFFLYGESKRRNCPFSVVGRSAADRRVGGSPFHLHHQRVGIPSIT